MSSMMPGPAGYSIAIPTGPVPDYKQLILDDPWRLQKVEWLQGDTAVKEKRRLEDKDLAQRLYDINVQQATQSASGGGGGGGDYGLAAATKRAELEREAAKHADVNQAEYLREMLASRGMVDSGQNAWEQQERQFQFGMQEKQIQADLEARQQAAAQAGSAAASARSNAQAGLTLQLDEMKVRFGADMTGYDRYGEDIKTDLARGIGGAGEETYLRLLGSGALKPGTKMASWDPASGLYQTADGQFYDASGNPLSWSPPVQQQQLPPPTPPPPVDWGSGLPPVAPSLGSGYYSGTPGQVGYKKPILE